jgi:acetylornithine deacetylase/succinyl-diaminopimelate desuccinylase-like protein
MTPPMKLTLPLFLSGAVCLVATPSPALAAGHAEAEAQTLDLSKQTIAMRSVQGPGNETPKVAALYRDTLVKAGWSPSDIEIVPVDDTAYLIATWKGSDPSLKPLVLSGHMDVVEAKRADWQRDPFVPVVENGYLLAAARST